jgi:hypothetical protein
VLPIDKWISGIDKWEGAKHIVEVVRTHELEGKKNYAETSVNTGSKLLLFAEYPINHIYAPVENS